MSDRLNVKVGAWPWQPSPGANLVKTYHLHQVPLIGLLHEPDTNTTHLFARRYTAEETLSVWMYVTVTQGDVNALDLSVKESRDHFRKVLTDLEAKRHVFYALAHSEQGVLSEFESRGPAPAARRLDHALEEAVQKDGSLRDDADEILELFARRQQATPTP